MKKELTKTYEPSLHEDGVYKKWEESGFFNPDKLAVTAKSQNYSIVMPPPNVTGTLHVGHAAMLALQDILIRYHRMKGKRVLWLPGTDHAAIATQTRVEKDLKAEGLDRHKLGREKFLARVNKFARDSHDTIVKQIAKMGSSCDWSREAYTLDETRNKAVRAVFKMMYDDGLIYRGDRVVNWCPRCQSTLADDEVEYKKQKAKLYTFKYSKDFPLTIATTRPETKLGDTAVAVNPKDKRYKKYLGKIYEIDFVGVKLKLKIIADRMIDSEFGTGALGVTPAHSMADWQLAQDHQLTVIKVINEEGKIKPGFNEFSGQTASQAGRTIVERLKKKGLLIKEEETENNLSICYRCETAVEPLPSLQWFINVNKKISRYKKSIKQLSIEAVKKGVFGREKIRIFPERFAKNYYHWMDNLRDWCISRQIWFGHRIPVWYCRGEDKGRCLPECVKPIVVIDEPRECPACGSKDLVRDEDTLDTWFSSGLWTFSTLARRPEQIKIKNGKLIIDGDDFKNFHPTAVLETGYDILFFWVARMIIMTTYATGDIPFRDVYLHGLVLDERGRKMSKSLGNVIDPLDTIKKYGADATRLSLVIGSTPGNDVNLSQEKIAGFRNFANKLWNIARYIIADYQLSAGDNNINVNALTEADNWILIKFGDLKKEISADLENYKFSQAGEKLREFTWDDLADWYLEVCKFEKDNNKAAILKYILEDLLKLWHPFIPFVTEAIWSELGKERLLLTEKWPSFAKATEGKPVLTKISKSEAIDDFELVKNIIVAIRNARGQHKIEPAKKIKAIIYAGGHKELIESQTHLIKNLRTGLAEVKIKEKGEKIKEAIYLTVGEIEIYLLVPLDRQKEQARIAKEIKIKESLIRNAEAKMKNKEFVAKAPVAVVNKEKEKLESWKTELKKLKEQLNNL